VGVALLHPGGTALGCSTQRRSNRMQYQQLCAGADNKVHTDASASSR
jgi:hypothetical protein